MACVSTRRLTNLFLEALVDRPRYARGCVPAEASSLDEARDIAKGMPGIHALVLLDDTDNLQFHYVR